MMTTAWSSLPWTANSTSNWPRSGGVTSSAVDWDTLTRLVAGEVVVPGSPGYDAVRKPAMARFHDVRPAAVVRCRTPGHLYARSEFFRRPLDRQTLQALARGLTRPGRHAPGPARLPS